jgi:predicted peroxiredoxin
MGPIMIHASRGKEDAERASLALVVGNTALASGQAATLLLTLEGVRLATQGYAAGVQAQDFPPLGDLLQQFVSRGGTIWVCGACAKPRHITPDQLVPGAQIIGAATAVEALVNGAQTLSF